MEAKRFIVNKTAYFGERARYKIVDEIKRYGYKKCFVVTDKDLVKFQITKMITDVIENEDIKYQVFDEVKANPTIKNVQMAVDAFLQSSADSIIAVGGGSVIDTAKAVSIIANNQKFYDVISLEGADKSEKPAVAVIAVPTTAGTGSETTMDYVITNEQQKRKMACMDQNATPIAAILDSEIMASLPQMLTAATAMDALTHAIESYTAVGSWTLSEALSLHAIELIAQNYDKVIDDPHTLEARDALSVAQYLAGMSFTNVGLGIVHSMAHPLSAYYNTPHGIANALILPYVMEYNAKQCSKKYRKISQSLGNYIQVDTTDAEAINMAIYKVQAFLDKAKLPKTLKELGVCHKDLEDLSQSAIVDMATADNPVVVTRQDILNLYQKMFE